VNKAYNAIQNSANAIFGKIGHIASEEVVLQLIKSKCISSLLYGLDACALTKSELSSLDFTVNRFFSETFQNRQHRGRQKLSSLLWI